MKYCKFCGRQLADNESCSCNDALQEQSITTMDEVKETEISDLHNPEVEETLDYNSQSGASEESAIASACTFDHTQQDENSQHTQAKNKQTAETLKAATHNILPFIKSLIHAPVSTIKASAENTDLPLAGIFFAIYFISMILCELCLASRAVSYLSKYIGTFSFASTYASIQYGWLLLSAFIMGIIIIVLTVGCAVLLSVIFHSSYSPKQVVAACGSIFVYPAAALIAAGILAFISIKLASLLLIFGIVAYLTMFCTMLKTLLKKEDNSSYLLLSIVFVTLLFILVSVASTKIAASFSDYYIKMRTNYTDNQWKDFFE